MIGDNPDTDIAGARAYGLASILIGAQSGIQFEDLLRAGGSKTGPFPDLVPTGKNFRNA
jgi:ribonucleotide monophosphatase NagD (HAD superfamily)